MLRFLIILLVLLNLLALAAWRGWLGEGDTRGEPERITNQLHPDRIRLLSLNDVAANAATPADDAPAAAPDVTEAPQKVEAPPQPEAPTKAEAPKKSTPTKKAEVTPKPTARAAASEAVESSPKPFVDATPPPPAAPAKPAPPPVPEPESEPPRATEENPPAPVPSPPAPVDTPLPSAMATPPRIEPPSPPPAAPVVAEAPPACVAFAGLVEEEARPLIEAARAQGQFETRDIVSAEIDSWWVFLPPLGGMTPAVKRSAELRALGISDMYIIPERGSHPYGISLGLYKSAESANERRLQLMALGVTGVVIEERAIDMHRVEIRGPSDRLSEWASSWASRQPRGSRLSCRP